MESSSVGGDCCRRGGLVSLRGSLRASWVLRALVIGLALAPAASQTRAETPKTSKDLSVFERLEVEFSPQAGTLLSSLPYAEPFVISANFAKGTCDWFGVAWREGSETCPEHIVLPREACKSSEGNWCYSEATKPIPKKDGVEPDTFKVGVTEPGGLRYRGNYTFCYYWMVRISANEADDAARLAAKRVETWTRQLHRLITAPKPKTEEVKKSFDKELPLSHLVPWLDVAQLPSLALAYEQFRTDYVTPAFNRLERQRTVARRAALLLGTAPPAAPAPAASLTGGYSQKDLMRLVRDPRFGKRLLAGDVDLHLTATLGLEVRPRKLGAQSLALQNLVSIFPKSAPPTAWESALHIQNADHDKIVSEEKKLAGLRKRLAAVLESNLQLVKYLRSTERPAPVMTRIDALQVFTTIDVGLSGLVYEDGSASVAPAVGVNFYFCPEDSNVPLLGRHDDWCRRFSLILGFLLANLSPPGGDVVGLIDDDVTPYMALGFRLHDNVRISLGVSLARVEHADLGNGGLAAAFQFGLSFDFNLAQALKSAAEALKAL